MKISNKNYLDQLNDRQSEAITHLDGPCLIVAGAGSGKTRVLTSRVVEIIKKKKAWPNQILCVTFTNKAAREMQNRIAGYLDEKILTTNAKFQVEINGNFYDCTIIKEPLYDPKGYKMRC